MLSSHGQTRYARSQSRCRRRPLTIGISAATRCAGWWRWWVGNNWSGQLAPRAPTIREHDATYTPSRQTCCVFTVPPDADGRARSLQTHARKTKNGAAELPRSAHQWERARRCNRRMAHLRFKPACFQAAAARLPSRRARSAASAISKRLSGEPPSKKELCRIGASELPPWLPSTRTNTAGLHNSWTRAAQLRHSYVTVTSQLRHSYVMRKPSSERRRGEKIKK